MRRVLAAASLAAFAGASAQADVVQDLGFGWEAVFVDPTHSDLAVDPGSSINNLRLEKTAEFTSLGPILIQFRQNRPDAQTATTITIDDEIINNNSGFDWIDFEMFLLNSGEAAFDPGASAGFSISPFTVGAFEDGNTLFHASGGVLANGAIWTPGLASGALVFHVDLSADTPVIFTLKEIPSIPAPGAVGLGAIIGTLALRRRR